MSSPEGHALARNVPSSALRIVVTRPVREAGRWLAELSGRGLDAQALPLIDIAPVLDDAPVRAAWQHLERYVAVMFVSGNAVARFFASRVEVFHGKWVRATIRTRAWSPGPGTTAALVEAGLPASSIDAPDDRAGQFDSEALWARVGPTVQPGQCVLIVRGGDAKGQGAGRDWLAEQLRDAGAKVDDVVAYRRIRPVWTAAQEALARRWVDDGSIWLFSSSEAVANLVASLPGQSFGQARAVATHPRIAQAAREAGFGCVLKTRPTLDDVVASIESLT